MLPNLPGWFVANSSENQSVLSQSIEIGVEIAFGGAGCALPEMWRRNGRGGNKNVSNLARKEETACTFLATLIELFRNPKQHIRNNEKAVEVCNQ